MITISIVSHGQFTLLANTLKKLIKVKEVKKIIITINIPEKIVFLKNRKVYFIKNLKPKGFGENHNNAFKFCNTNYFCVMNPDIEINKNPFQKLLNFINDKTPLVSPLIVDSKLRIEDNARYFPTPIFILKKLFFNQKGMYEIENLYSNKTIYPDWVAGMFMVFTKKIFKKLNGFDQNYFLYYEDVDICFRLKKLKKRILVLRDIKVIHNARRSSRKNLKFFLIHLWSMIIFFYKCLGRFPKNEK